MSTPTQMGWHFLPANGRLANGDDRLVVAGEWLTHDGPLVLCGSGLHWSARAIDALRYAPGPVACRVETRGETVVGDDKCVSAERRALWVLSATDGERVLRAFARQCAADVLPLWGRPVPSVVVQWIVTGDDAARATAAVAARAARDAAWAAAGAAAWAAAMWASAAGDAAWAAARDAAWAAAWAAAWDARNVRLEAWLTAAHEGRWGEIVVVIPDGVDIEQEQKQ